MTVQGRLCEQHFLSNVEFCPDQRLMVRLPFAENPTELGKTLALAQRRFSSIERRLERDPAVLEGYVSFMDEYERLNHMMELQPSSVPRNHYFIPYHCVIEPDRSTTKLRVVFDALAPSSTGRSLNNILGSGRLFRVICYQFCYGSGLPVRVHSRREKNVSTNLGSSSRQGLSTHSMATKLTRKNALLPKRR